MDTLYIGDIPENYHYARFNNGYIDLFDRPNVYNQTLTYYRIYTNNNGFFYTTGSQYFSTTTTYFQDVNVSDNWMYRSDIDKIFVVCFIIFFMFIFVFNIITSIYKKGGVFGGLL